jgi:hypothetical protein
MMPLQVQTILSTKPEVANFSEVARIMGSSAADMEAEWRILRRLPGDLGSQDSMINLAVAADKAAMFPTMSAVVRKLLLLPVGTASVERSFSTMNRILSSQRCRLLPNHVCQLMQLSIEGPAVPDVRDGTENQQQAWDELIKEAYAKWLEQPRRGLV